MQPAPDDIVLVRGGGDIATGVVWRLHHAGFRVVVAELPQPLTIRRTVAVSSAVISGHIDIEGLAAGVVVMNRQFALVGTLARFPL